MIFADDQSVSVKTAEEAAKMHELDNRQRPHKPEGIRVWEGGGGELSVLNCTFLCTVHFLCFELQGAAREKTSVSRRVGGESSESNS